MSLLLRYSRYFLERSFQLRPSPTFPLWMIENSKLFQMIARYTLENEHIERKVMEGDGSDEFPFQVPAFQPRIFRGVPPKKLT